MAEAARLGRSIEQSAVRHGGRATWVADDARNAGLRRMIRTIEADLTGGTAGVAWFLARLAEVTADPRSSILSGEAFRSALDRGPALIESQRYGWYDGALGVAWAAIDGGHSLGVDEIVDGGIALANDAVARLTSLSTGHAGLVGGAAGVVAGVLGVADLLGDRSGIEQISALPALLLAALPTSVADRTGPGLASGTTGIALALAAISSASGDREGEAAARRALYGERVWHEPGAGWYAVPAHPSQHTSHAVDWSWCAGAAGIGLAHLAAFVRHGDISDLADLTAAVEVVRRSLAVDSGIDPSLCHGTSGAIDFLLTTGVTLAEPAHVAAARRSGFVLMERWRNRVGGPVAVSPGAPDPSLMFGLAGTGLVMLRLSDDARTPSPTLPSFLMAPPDDGASRPAPWAG